MNIVYRGFTAEQLQAQYSARDAVPEHAEIFKRWQVSSAVYRTEANALLDLAYGISHREKLDLFLPAAPASKPPLFLFIHGGYWQAMDKSFSSFIARELVKQGAAVAVVNYDLCPAVTLEVIIEQIRRAVVWLGRHAGEYGIDSQHLHLCGHSAGGQLIAMLVATDWKSMQPDFDNGVIRSALSISGVFDLEPLIHTTINSALALDLQSAHRHSPLRMQPYLKIPLLLTVGGDEPAEFHRQSEDLARSWAGFSVPTRFESHTNLNHFTMIDQLAKPGSPLLERALALMGLASKSAG